MSTALATLTSKLAARLNMDGAGEELTDILKATAFKGPASDAQMTALMIVANQYGLNPWTKEIYAFPDKNNGIVPVVGVDGWSRIINEHPQFDGMEFETTADSCTCVMFRKDRSHAIRVTEYMDECKRNTQPWQSHPRRMLRHKTLIQCARLAFGYTGIYDQDEAERIVEGTEGIGGMPSGTVIDGRSGEVIKQIPPYPSDKFKTNLPKWAELIRSGEKTADQIIATVSSKAVLSDEQKSAIRNAANSTAGSSAQATPGGAGAAASNPAVTFAQVEKKLRDAADTDLLDAAADLIGEIADEQQRKELGDIYRTRREELSQ